MKTTSKKVEQEKKEFMLKEAFALWKSTSKSGTEYLTGKDFNGNKIVAFYNPKKKNPKEPDIRVYKTEDDKNIEIASLWDSKSKNGRQYLTGTGDEKEKLVGFYGVKEKAPYIKVYFKDTEDLPF